MVRDLPVARFRLGEHGLPSGQAAWALAHQLGHVLVHNTITHPPGTTTTGCHGIGKAEADSVAFITCTRYGIRPEHAFSSPRTWAGTDPRAQPAAAILTAGERATTAAATISRLLDHRPGRRHHRQPGPGMRGSPGSSPPATRFITVTMW